MGSIRWGTKFCDLAAERLAGLVRGRGVRYWPLADIASCTAHVRFRGQSGHRSHGFTLRKGKVRVKFDIF